MRTRYTLRSVRGYMLSYDRADADRLLTLAAGHRRTSDTGLRYYVQYRIRQIHARPGLPMLTRAVY